MMEMMRLGHRLVSLLLIGMTLSWTPLASADDPDGPIVLQIKVLALPAVSDKGYRGRTTLTPYMVVKDAEAMRRVCSRLPRLLDVILVAFDEEPVKLNDRMNDLAARQDALGKKIESSLGVGVFEGFYLVQGSRRRAEGTEALKISGGSRECQPIKYLPWEKTPPDEVLETANRMAGEPAGAGMANDTQAGSTPPPAVTTTVDDDPLPSPEELERERRRNFPPEPPRPQAPSWILIALVILGLGGLMLVIGSYIGYQIAKILRDRRRRDRRRKKKDRRAGIDRRQRDDGPPAEGDRRAGKERRIGKDRRLGDRRDVRDRRDDPPAPSE